MLQTSLRSLLQPNGNRRNGAAVPAPILFLTENDVVSIRAGDKQVESGNIAAKPKWNLKDGEKLRVVKEVLHVSSEPSRIACHEDEQNMVLEFCTDVLSMRRLGAFTFVNVLELEYR